MARGIISLMEVNFWGVFVDRVDGALMEIMLPEELSNQVLKFIESLAEDDKEYVIQRNLDPDEKYKIW
tara:strand:- start:56 stop:259 length:204 start_codon:yes stop_codon:yes gene_type:complete